MKSSQLKKIIDNEKRDITISGRDLKVIDWALGLLNWSSSEEWPWQETLELQRRIALDFELKGSK